nr:hypothetical protein [Enterocloster clostridioformis]
MELGVPLGQAVDGSASNDGSNLLEEMRVAYLLHRLRWSRQVVKEGRLVRMDEERTVVKVNLVVKEYIIFIHSIFKLIKGWLKVSPL